MTNESVDDIFDVQNPSILLHQVNALGFGSTGMMLKVRKNYPDLFQQYHQLCGWFKGYKLQEELIGTFQALPIPNSQNILCNAFSQRFFTDTKYEVDLDAWSLVLKKICRQILAKQKESGILYEVHAPSKLGIGMKSSEIEAMKEVVESFFSDSNPIVFTYHL